MGQQPPLLRQFQAQQVSQLHLQEQQRCAVLTVCGSHSLRHGGPLRRIRFHGRQQVPEQPQGRRLLGQVSVDQPPGGKGYQQLPVCLFCPLQG